MFGTLKTSLFFCSVIAFNILAQPIETLQLKTGLWEGIRESDFSYKLLEINTNGQHRMFNLNITSAFKKGQLTPFTDNDINCSIAECIINITNPNNVDENTRLIMSPYFDDSFKVIEISTNKNHEPVFTQTYQLDKQEKQSTVREFIHMYKKRMDSLMSINKNDFYGFWLGILNIEGKLELLSFEAHPDNSSHFIRFMNGNHFVNKTSFSPEDVTISGDLIQIQTDHPTFANKLLIHKSNSVLEGYMYSTHNSTTLQKGTFQLYRMKE